MPVHVALDNDGKYTSSNAACKERGPFTCGECKENVFYKPCKNGKMKAHFAHFSSSCNGKFGSSESPEHLLAKVLFSENLSKWTLRHICSQCIGEISANKELLTNDYNSTVEFPITIDGKDYRLDVGVTSNSGSLFMAVEIYKTHEIGLEKYSDLDNATGGRCYELNADDVLACVDSGEFDINIRTDKICDTCIKENEARKEQGRLDREAEKRKRKRPCVQCRQWSDKDVMFTRKSILASQYPLEYICNKCHADCPICCADESTTDEIKDYHRCMKCNMRGKEACNKLLLLINSTDISAIQDVIVAAMPCVAWYPSLQSLYSRMEKYVAMLIESAVRTKRIKLAHAKEAKRVKLAAKASQIRKIGEDEEKKAATRKRKLDACIPQIAACMKDHTPILLTDGTRATSYDTLVNGYSNLGSDYQAAFNEYIKQQVQQPPENKAKRQRIV